MSDRPTARSDQRRPAPSLVLMGLRGCGKSTLGRLAAQRAGVAFVDLDGVVAQALGGGSISDIWSRLGEARFREAEREALAALRLGGPDPGARVIALGGGTPTAPGAAAMLADAADAGAISLVYLFAAPDLLRSRLALGGAGDRPSLTGAGTLAEIEAVFAARDPLYRRLATLVLGTAGRSVESLADELAALIDARRPPPARPGRTPAPTPDP